MQGLRRRMALPTGATPPPVLEALSFTDPADTDEPDAPVNLGVRFAVTAPGMWWGCRVRIPDVAPGVATAVQAYDDDTATLLASQAFAPVAGGYQDVLFAAPVPVGPGVNYAAAWWTDRYCFTLLYPWPASSPSARIATGNLLEGLFTYAAAPAQPSTTAAANFYVSPLVEF